MEQQINRLPEPLERQDVHYLRTTPLDTALVDARNRLTAIEEQYLHDIQQQDASTYHGFGTIDRTAFQARIDDLRAALATIEARAKEGDA